MLTEKKLLTAITKEEFTPLPDNTSPGNIFPTRDENNKKIEVTDLFTHFTASIIQENTSFTR